MTPPTLQVPHKVLAYGPPGSGKTTLITASLVEYLRDGLKLKPEQVRIGVLDNDGGIAELVEQGIIDPAWLQSFIGLLDPCSDWQAFLKKSAAQVKELLAWQAKHGIYSAWQVTDNVDTAYKWCRDHYGIQVYGMTEAEYIEQRRNEYYAANQNMKGAPPSFKVQDGDWGAVGRKYSTWADPLKLSGLNFMWTAPESDWEVKDKETGDKVRTIKPKGQGDNPGRVSHILRMRFEEVPNAKGEQYFADLEKNRGGTMLFQNMPNPTYLRLRRWVDANSPNAVAAKRAAQSSPQTTPAVKA